MGSSKSSDAFGFCIDGLTLFIEIRKEATNNKITTNKQQQQSTMKTTNNYRAAALAVLVLQTTSKRGVGLDASGFNVSILNIVCVVCIRLYI